MKMKAQEIVKKINKVFDFPTLRVLENDNSDIFTINDTKSVASTKTSQALTLYKRYHNEHKKSNKLRPSTSNPHHRSQKDATFKLTQVESKENIQPAETTMHDVFNNAISVEDYNRKIWDDMTDVKKISAKVTNQLWVQTQKTNLKTLEDRLKTLNSSATDALSYKSIEKSKNSKVNKRHHGWSVDGVNSKRFNMTSNGKKIRPKSSVTHVHRKFNTILYGSMMYVLI